MKPLLAHAEMALANAMDRLIAAAQREGELTVIGLPRDWSGFGALIDAFKAKYGLMVNELNPNAASAGELAAIKRGGPAFPAPDVIDVGFSFGRAAKKDGLLQPYKVSTWDSIPDTVKDPEGFWYGNYYGVLAFEANADRARNVPLDWQDLQASEYKNSVALAGNPLASDQAIQAVHAAGLSAGASRDRAAGEGLRFFAELHRKGNLVPMVGDSDSLVRGVTPILIRWDFLALGDRDRLAGGPKIEIVVPKTGIVGGVYVQAISASAPHPNAAKLWMEHLYSDAGQLTLLSGYCRPIRFDDLARSGRVPARMLERLPEIRNGEADSEPVFPTVEELENARETITNGWDDIVGVTIPCPPPSPSPRPPTSLNAPPPEAPVLS
jgi:putative spermidine/putrescine transport system substrate-binding protein